MYYVYILTNRLNTVLYTGVTHDLLKRLYEHEQHLDPESFTAKYHVHKLIYYEATGDIRSAIAREKEIKGWTRAKKEKLIATINPSLRNLKQDLV